MVSHVCDSPRQPAPFLKWVGGKRRFLSHLRRLLPAQFERYHEPFLGGGAVFFDLAARHDLRGRAVLSDANADLMNAYRWVHDDVELLTQRLQSHKYAHSRRHFNYMRRLHKSGHNHKSMDVDDAAQFLYLASMSFNGAWRVDRAGGFAGAMSTQPQSSRVATDRFCAASIALQGVELKNGFFPDTVLDAGEGDLVYLDPPYLLGEDARDVVGYTARRFNAHDLDCLVESVRDMHRRGVQVVLSQPLESNAVRFLAGFRAVEVASSHGRRELVICSEDWTINDRLRKSAEE
jgi:DNA adenine methylase